MKLPIAAFLLAVCAPMLVRGTAFSVMIDTTPIAGLSGSLAFDLLGGNPFQNNIATVSAFTTTGSLGASSSSGSVSGNLRTGPLTLTADQFFNEGLQGIAFAAGLTTFQLDLTTNFIAMSVPDSFAFFLLDSTLVPFTTGDPSGSNALFAVDLTGSSTPAQVFMSPSATVTVTPLGTAVPEPASGALVSMVLALLAGKVLRGAVKP